LTRSCRRRRERELASFGFSSLLKRREEKLASFGFSPLLKRREEKLASSAKQCIECVCE